MHFFIHVDKCCLNCLHQLECDLEGDGDQVIVEDEEAIGKTSVMKNVLTITTLAGAKAAIEAMSNLNKISVEPLQEYFKY